MRDNKVNMLSGSITKGLITLTIPIIIMNVMQALFNFTDMLVLRSFADDMAVGAVGACSTLIALCTNLLVGISVGVNVVVGKKVGRGDREETTKAVATALLLAALGGIFLAVFGVLFAETFLKMTNCPKALLAQAVAYFKIYFCGVPLIMVYTFCAAILRAIGDTKKLMYFLILGGIIKLLATIALVPLPDTPVKGVALATIVSYFAMSTLTFRALQKRKEFFALSFKGMRPYMAALKEILFIGIPAGIQSSLYAFANVVIMSAVNSFGPDATTGVSIANQFDGVISQICNAPALAAVPYMAQNIGAGNVKRAKAAFRKSILITTAIGASFGLLSAVFSVQLASILSKTPEVIAFARQKMIVISSTYFIYAISEVFGGALRSLSRPILPTVTTLIFTCFLRIFWVYVLFPLCPNLTFLYLSWPIGWTAAILIQLMAYIPAVSRIGAEK